jgi:hypothetical protein
MNALVLREPGARLKAVVTAEIVGDDEEIARGVVGFDVGKPRDVAFRIARGRTPGQFLAITHPQRSVHPAFLRPALIVQRRLDAMSIGRPAWGWIKGTWHYGPQFVGADGSLALGWLGGVADDRRSFGTKSLSRGVPQLCVCRKPHALTQQDGADLAAFDWDSRVFGRLRQRREAKLR